MTLDKKSSSPTRAKGAATNHAKTKFSAEEFTPTRFSTAQDKAEFANHFVRFVESGFKRTLFTKKFYQRLSNTFGHIAHYNIHGFWEYWFETPQKRLQFLKHCSDYHNFMLGSGDPHHTYGDVEKALRRWILQTRQAEKLDLNSSSSS